MGLEDGLDDCADRLDRMWGQPGGESCLVSEADTRRGMDEAQGGQEQRCVECDNCDCTVVMLNWKGRPAGALGGGVFKER